MKLRTHSCAAAGCQRVISVALLMCQDHWRMVPVAIRREILTELRFGLFVDRAAYRDAVARAVAAVKEKQERKALGGPSGSLFNQA